MSHKAYYKARRLKSRHARRGHSQFCYCPEEIDRMLIGLRRKFGDGWAGVCLTIVERKHKKGNDAEPR